ncbi:monovalent cation/H(+) antiporter subunit G [Rhizobium sp. SGZ-381]|uniref:monovalent cation/H(+) antiporter subunit G n=1 Tax=Rhizobium sp. SGZ-381 TaxID=3342800 RepID=UPI00366C8B1D
MISWFFTFLTVLLIITGGLFALVASIGLLRLPDVFSRMHAASKAGTVASGLLLIAVGVHSGDISIFVRALAGFVFFILTAPISAHLLARAAHHVGYPLHSSTVIDELRNGSP